ncbi:MAG TPA: primary-amine oxidase [Candidatus Acidoferrum sp.]|nr:primary-amine oxidase [Candidatus Acidoferrum sp.]
MRLTLALLPLALVAATHPLAPLTGPEIRTATEILRADSRVPSAARISMMALDEPAKDAVLRHTATARRAFAVLYDYSGNRTWEAVANLETHKLDRLQEIPGAEPMVTGDDSVRADQIVRNDPGWQRAMLARGIRDLNTVAIIAWTAGYFALPGTEQGRIVRAVPYSYDGNTRNIYAHPIEGVVAHVNLTTGKVLELIDTDRKLPIPRDSAELPAIFNAPLREPPAPLNITQPNGPGFRIEDGEVHWQKWRFRWALHPREGLVVYGVGYEDGGGVRPVMYRGSLSEMLVPYGDPSLGWYFRNSFDAGELGLGINATPMTPGVDCPQNCSTYDAVFASPDGQPMLLRRAVALYERDGGFVWKHDTEARRARDLVLSFVSTVGNYDYGFEWIFHQDGAIDVRVLLTGIMAAKAVANGAHDPYSHMVAKNVAAPHHQHFFTFRLDMDVDGVANRVVEMNSSAVPVGKENPFGGAFQMHGSPLNTEREAQRNLNLASGRKWIVESTSRKNGLGMPTGFALLPGENAVAFAAPESWVRKRAPFLEAHIFVTPYRAGEMYAGGDYPNQSRGGDGLARWTKDNRPVANTDVVLWYTLGVTHNPRPEDWPVMPVHAAGFRLVPWGFFDKNPAMDLPSGK